MGRVTAPDWTEDEDEWLREFYPLYPNAELAKFKAQDGWPRDEGSLARRARLLGIRKDPSRGYRKPQPATVWTPEALAWAREFVPGHSWREISAEHERVFGTTLTRSMVSNAKRRAGVRSGTTGGRFEKGSVPANKGRTWDEMGISEESRERIRATQFRKGQLPHNAGELLDERLSEHNVWQVKVDCRDAKNPMDYWVSRARFNWERANGRPWPEGHRPLHIDRDPLNDDADNIEPIPTELWPMVCGAVRGQLPWHDRETLRAAVAYARITLRRSELERERRRVEGHPWACDRARYARGADRAEDE